MIERLAREYREVVTLVELEGLTQNEIHLGWSRSVTDYTLRDPQSNPCGCPPW